MICATMPRSAPRRHRTATAEPPQFSADTQRLAQQRASQQPCPQHCREKQRACEQPCPNLGHQNGDPHNRGIDHLINTNKSGTSIVFVSTRTITGMSRTSQELHCGICDKAQFALCVLVSAVKLKSEQSVDERNMRHLHALGLKGLPKLELHDDRDVQNPQNCHQQRGHDAGSASRSSPVTCSSCLKPRKIPKKCYRQGGHDASRSASRSSPGTCSSCLKPRKIP